MYVFFSKNSFLCVIPLSYIQYCFMNRICSFTFLKKRSERQRRKEKIYPSEGRFQTIARRDKKVFLSKRCKQTEENNRMGNTRDLFKKIRDTKGIFHAKMGSIKDRNGIDLTEAEDIKKKWQKYTELYKKYLHDPYNHDSVITHLEPHILECEVKWPLGIITMNKTSGGDGIVSKPKR